jgi:hypothetical protein
MTSSVGPSSFIYQQSCMVESLWVASPLLATPEKLVERCVQMVSNKLLCRVMFLIMLERPVQVSELG